MLFLSRLKFCVASFVIYPHIELRRRSNTLAIDYEGKYKKIIRTSRRRIRPTHCSLIEVKPGYMPILLINLTGASVNPLTCSTKTEPGPIA